MVIVDGKSYESLAKKICETDHKTKELLGHGLFLKLPVTLDPSDNRCSLSLWIGSSEWHRHGPADGLIFWRQLKRNSKAQHLFLFSDSETEELLVMFQQIEISEAEHELLLTGLDRLGRLLDFFLNPCCREIPNKFWSLNLNSCLRYCQFCGNRTGIEFIPNEIDQSRFGVIDSFLI